MAEPLGTSSVLRKEPFYVASRIRSSFVKIRLILLEIDLILVAAVSLKYLKYFKSQVS